MIRRPRLELVLRPEPDVGLLDLPALRRAVEALLRSLKLRLLRFEVLPDAGAGAGRGTLGQGHGPDTSEE